MKALLEELEANVLRGEQISAKAPLRQLSDTLEEAARDLDSGGYRLQRDEKRRLAMLCATMALRYIRKL
jgi:hypothetical protein